MVWVGEKKGGLIIMCTTHFKALQLLFGNSTTTDFTLLYHMILADWSCMRVHGTVAYAGPLTCTLQYVFKVLRAGE